LSTSDIIIELSSPSRAGIILPSENVENENLLMLLMPMMIAENA
jgi:DNA polymerase-3 subunit beta